MTSAATAADPHQGVQECVSLVTGLHRQVDAILVAARVDSVGHVSVNDLLENILGTCQPAFCAHNDKRWRLIDSLKNIIGTQIGRRVFGHNLCILTARLFFKVRHYT